MQTYFNWYRDQQGNAIQGGQVTVYNANSSTLATIYTPTADGNSTSAKANPFTTDANGYFEFAAPNGDYSLVLSGNSVSTATIQNINLWDGGSTTGGPMVNPMTALGSVIYGGASPAGTPNELPPNTTTTPKYLREVGTGTAGQAPTWAQPAASEVSNTPAGTIAATNVQAAINEIVSDLADTVLVTNGDALVGVKAPLSGAVATTQHEHNSRRVSVRDFGAVGDGITDDTAALERAGQALASGMALEFEPNKTYLVSYIWTPNTDTMSGESDGVGRGRGIFWFHDIQNVTLLGNGATIKCTNHDIAANGGFAFLYARRAPGLTVNGFKFDMSFTGYKDSASFYPLCGGLIVTDNPSPAGSGTQTTLCSNFTAKDLVFKLYHPNGSFAITSHPMGGDVNNGFKILSVYAAGDTSASASYDAQNRGFFASDIRFSSGHNGYGIWVHGYNDTDISSVHAEAWVAASYTIATLTYTGVNFISPVRVYQYYCSGLRVRDVFVRALPQASRTGAFQGVCGGMSLFSGVGTLTTGGAIVSDCQFILDSSSTTLGSNPDRGIQSTLNGRTVITGCTFTAHQQSGVACIVAKGSDNATGMSEYIVNACQASTNINGPFFQLDNGSLTSAANRTIKAVTLSGNIIRGFGSEGAFQSITAFLTYHGVESLTLTGNTMDARLSPSAVYGVVCQTVTATDNVTSTDNKFYCPGAHDLGTTIGGTNVVVRDNQVVGATVSSTLNAPNYLTNNYWQWQTFAAGQTVALTIATGDYNNYNYIEYTGAGAVAYFRAGVANSTTGTIRIVAAGNTGQLTFIKFGSLR